MWAVAIHKCVVVANPKYLANFSCKKKKEKKKGHPKYLFGEFSKLTKKCVVAKLTKNMHCYTMNLKFAPDSLGIVFFQVVFICLFKLYNKNIFLAF